MTQLFYSPKKIQEFLEVFEELQHISDEFRRRMCEVLSVVLERETQCCVDCGRPMVPRRLWDNLSLDERPTKICARAGDETRCHVHLIRYRQKKGLSRRKPLEYGELQKLRRAVGLE
jgi:hypothetical protein